MFQCRIFSLPSLFSNFDISELASLQRLSKIMDLYVTVAETRDLAGVQQAAVQDASLSFVFVQLESTLLISVRADR